MGIQKPFCFGAGVITKSISSKNDLKFFVLNSNNIFTHLYFAIFTQNKIIYAIIIPLSLNNEMILQIYRKINNVHRYMYVIIDKE